MLRLVLGAKTNNMFSLKVVLKLTNFERKNKSQANNIENVKIKEIVSIATSRKPKLSFRYT